MNFMNLRAYGPDFSVDEFLAEHRLDVSSIWRKGDDRPSGRKYEDSGFDIGFPDAASWVVGLPVIRAFLDSNAAPLEKLRLLGVCVDLVLALLLEKSDPSLRRWSFH